MATTAQSISDRFAYVLKDESHVRWTDTEFLSWINAAQVEIIGLRPIALTENATLSLTSGIKQTITGMLLINVVRNTSGSAVTPCEMGALNVSYPAWTSLEATDTVKHYMRDPRERKVFYVYPPNSGSGSLDLLQAKYPTAITSTAAGSLSLPDEYADAVLDYCLYRAFSKDAEEANSAQADKHRTAFMAAVSETGQTAG